jgi:hypothetical protein
LTPAAVNVIPPKEVEVTRFLTMIVTILVGSWVGVEAYVLIARTATALGAYVALAARST